MRSLAPTRTYAVAKLLHHIFIKVDGGPPIEEVLFGKAIWHHSPDRLTVYSEDGMATWPIDRVLYVFSQRVQLDDHATD